MFVLLPGSVLHSEDHR